MHPIRPTRYPIGHVYYEFYFYKSANGGAVSLFNVSHNILYRLSLTALYSYFTALTTCHGHRNNYSYAVSLHYKPWVVKYLSIFRDCGCFFLLFLLLLYCFLSHFLFSPSPSPSFYYQFIPLWTTICTIIYLVCSICLLTSFFPPPFPFCSTPIFLFSVFCFLFSVL